MHSDSLSDLVDWFTAHDGTFDCSALTFAQIEGLGWGAFALRDLQVQPLAIIAIFFFLTFRFLSAGNTVDSTRCTATVARSYAAHITSPSHPLDPHLLSALSSRRI